ncbi:hypothetical protein CERZMDRAFT_95205 [Cercospora zeae-maydis SCOH1-5]|uniref:Uncharacterized protein n=1 Tax=Cercospora zeae-maydis SCOH1-5 TaxID=717836 RepID=A0A6A6FN43_9PEZI|nr:hypothetical protein CERZMDRAFT_95205 [Cercospora zeae-maydis SCOH1-5]
MTLAILSSNASALDFYAMEDVDAVEGLVLRAMSVLAPANTACRSPRGDAFLSFDRSSGALVREGSQAAQQDTQNHVGAGKASWREGTRQGELDVSRPLLHFRKRDEGLSRDLVLLVTT